jgi:aconitate hydratase
MGDKLKVPNIRLEIERGEEKITIENLSSKDNFKTLCNLSERSRQIILAGGLLNFIKEKKELK